VWYLFCFQVLHSDLKVRNVLLKSDASPRGCIAKVADFGLAVKMDCMDTHISAFQVCVTPAAPFRLLARSQQETQGPGLFCCTPSLMLLAGRNQKCSAVSHELLSGYAHQTARSAPLCCCWMDTVCCVLQGTMSHLAPEALLHGHISKAADVYAMGITLWELFTGGQAYQGAL
jgi:serine/threonine protein kinase